MNGGREELSKSLIWFTTPMQQRSKSEFICDWLSATAMPTPICKCISNASESSFRNPKHEVLPKTPNSSLLTPHFQNQFTTLS